MDSCHPRGFFFYRNSEYLANDKRKSESSVFLTYDLSKSKHRPHLHAADNGTHNG